MIWPFHSRVHIQKKTKTVIQKVTCTPVLIAVLFTTDNTWKQPKSPSTDNWFRHIVEKQVKTTVRYHLTLARMVINKESTGSSLVA